MNKHGQTIESLSLHNCAAGSIASAFNLTEIFEVVPNLKHLDFYAKGLTISNTYNHDNVLGKLESLELHIDSNASLDFLHFLMPNTIRTFEITKSDWIHLPQFLQQQSNIMHLEVSNNHGDIEIFNHLKLDTLKIACNTHVDRRHEENFIVQMLQRHPEMKKVESILSGMADDQGTSLTLLRAYCESKNLEYLDLSVSSANVIEMQRISQLPKLKEVVFYVDEANQDDFMELASIRLDAVEKISIFDFFGKKFTNELLFEFAGQSWPNLKHFHAVVPSKFAGGIDLLNLYLDNFPELEHLHIWSDGEQRPDESRLNRNQTRQNILKFNACFRQYPNLKRLKIECATVWNFEDLIAALPNVESIEVDEYARIDYTPRCLCNLTQAKNLKHLEVGFYEQSSSARFSDREAIWMKQLCKSLKRFKIGFGSSAAFLASLQNQLQGCDFIDIGPFYDNEIILSAVEY